jgi:hypothetical protein
VPEAAAAAVSLEPQASPRLPNGPHPGDSLACALRELEGTASTEPQPAPRPAASGPAPPAAPGDELVGFADFVEVAPSAAASPVANAVPASGPPKHDDELDDVFVELIEE